jgi:hypothetical protein
MASCKLWEIVKELGKARIPRASQGTRDFPAQGTALGTALAISMTKRGALSRIETRPP